ncbi:uncharacterized protein B0P05DRAFT_536401 [Gilbertella persicaria]|uniref:BZIP domain-containing protein n=1 Tax=Rhizopus stolonifer TaxID=4846 RepID=A0A367KLT9_RHIST|nr:uncharacterized protein B0P05DRAFT_536401 [Gilbertella persicaria]KAI8084170.1 hypothetical protein B0P05DRAFT_536401 [Gilbertella persicaria]RCI03147.1 hypothetical protein CU098_003828 [Rhizopus stolonifer]
MTYIKPDPEQHQQEDQEDFIMSYLNADYLATETPLSPPSSDSSLSTGSPEKHSVDDFMLDINPTDLFSAVMEDQPAYHPQLFNPCLPQQHQTADLGSFPFFLPTAAPTDPSFIQPFAVPIVPSSTVEEQPKKKRGRKKREPVNQTVSPLQPSLLAPKPLAPRPQQPMEEIKIKSEPVILDPSPLLAGPTTPENIDQQQSQEALKQAQIQKRQERLIKNRAAALLSRKRKREHLTLLEEEKQSLLTQNEQLNQKVESLETKVQSLEQENSKLKEQLSQYQQESTIISMDSPKRSPIHHHQPKSKAATGVVFMIILFSFALFTLPSRTASRLTVGGGEGHALKKQLPLIGSSISDDYCQGGGYECQQQLQQTNTTDLVLIDSVRPRDLQTWINQKLDVKMNNNRLISWPVHKEDQKESTDHVYLYSKEFSQLASLHSPLTTKDNEFQLPTISLISPYNQTVTQEQCDSYLQIDVQVLRSTVIKGQLMSLRQFGSGSTALLDGMKDDLITNTTQRRRREKRTQKISRVVV